LLTLLLGLLEISSNLSRTLELDPLLPKIVDSLFNLFRQADRCFLVQVEEGTNRLLPRVVKTRRPQDGKLRFTHNGRTVDIQAYTRFLRNLEASPWITDVTPVSAQTVVEQERAVTAFTIRARYKQADSAYVRTVPLSQSVR